MKYIKIVFFSTMFIGIAGNMNAQSSGIKNSLHNFSTQSWNQTAALGATSSATNINLGGSICAPCHAPHTYSTVDYQTIATMPGAPSNAPLWSHQFSAVASYTLYSGYNMDSTAATTIAQPFGTSKLCLSCHDGTVSLNYYRTYRATSSGIQKTTIANVGGAGLTAIDSLGTDISNDHPISFAYDAGLSARTNGAIKPTSTPSMISINGHATNGTIASDMLEGGLYVQCTSCHDPHNDAGAPHMLVKSNTGSALCLTCHNK